MAGRTVGAVALLLGAVSLTGRAGAGDVEFPPVPSPAELHFQQLLTGKLPGQPTRVRWDLRLLPGGAARLKLTTRTGDAPAHGATYAGKWTRDHRGLELFVESSHSEEDLPHELSLSCLRAVLDVLPAGADLVPGDACKGDGPRPYFRPSRAQPVAVWHCSVVGETVGPWNGYQQRGPLSFAARPAAGIEWLYVNHDCAGQEGAYRFSGGAAAPATSP